MNTWAKVFVSLQGLDVGTTLIGFSRGLVEGNPLMVLALMHGGWVGLVLVKVLVVTLVVGLAMRSWSRRGSRQFTKVFLGGWILAYVLVVVNNLMHLATG